MAHKSDEQGYHPERHAGITANMQKQGLVNATSVYFDRAERVMVRGIEFYNFHYYVGANEIPAAKRLTLSRLALLISNSGHMSLFQSDCNAENIESMKKDELIGVVTGNYLPSEVAFGSGSFTVLVAYVVATRGRVLFRADGFSPESMRGLERLVRSIEKRSYKRMQRSS